MLPIQCYPGISRRLLSGKGGKGHCVNKSSEVGPDPRIVTELSLGLEGVHAREERRETGRSSRPHAPSVREALLSFVPYLIILDKNLIHKRLW